MAKLYEVLLCDPPWSYGNKKTGGSMKSGSEDKYPVLPLETIKGMGVNLRAIVNPMYSYLFLWATCPMLPEALEVMTYWGYTYKTMVTWEKTGRLGMGFYFRVNTEHLLVGVRGSTSPFRCSERNVIRSKPRGHSRKPEEAYQLIEKVTVGMERAELFSREKRENWDSWGLEVKNDFEIEGGVRGAQATLFLTGGPYGPNIETSR